MANPIMASTSATANPLNLAYAIANPIIAPTLATPNPPDPTSAPPIFPSPINSTLAPAQVTPETPTLVPTLANSKPSNIIIEVASHPLIVS